MERNIFLYWEGNEFKLISILRNIIYLHSTNGKGYKVNLINKNNIKNYIPDIPQYFNKLCLAHQADFVRVNVIHDYGGIWLDSDTLVMESLDPLFDILEKNDGFFILQNNEVIWNGVFGSKKNTPLMKEWKRIMFEILNKKGENINWTEIGNDLLTFLLDKKLFENFIIFKGLDCMYPVNWDKCVDEFIKKPYDNYKNIIRDFQPIICLVNSVYKNMEFMSEYNIINSDMPISYFIKKSFSNMDLIDYDFIEIGTSNFDTLIQKANDTDYGISVDIIKYYLDCLPNKNNVKKLNIGVSDKTDTVDAYYIPEDVIEKNNLPSWFKGCNSIYKLHPLHIKHNVQHLCCIEKIKIIPTSQLFYENKVKRVKLLKIDTEGHDCTILLNLFKYILYLPKLFYPSKIIFESNEHSNPNNVDEIIFLYRTLGYILESKGYDTILTFQNDN